MADRIRVGIVGATVTEGGSGWGADAHVPAIHALPDFELKAVCTAHEDTALASKEAFGAELAFHDIDEMAQHPEVDLVAVSVRVPLHYPLVMAGLRAGKAVFCEWPLGANVAEAEEMANFARERGIPTMVGLQGRSDATLRYARDLIADGYVGEVLMAHLITMSPAHLNRGAGRVWQKDRENGANTLTIAGGHSIDGLCFMLGEFAELTARVETRVKEWFDTDLNQPVPVTAPDSIAIAGRLESGAEVAVQVGAVPVSPSGARYEIYGRQGTLIISSSSAQIGPNTILGAKAGEELQELRVPDEYTFVPEGAPGGRARNVAQAYARIADALQGGDPYSPDFDDAVQRHRLIEAIERSASEGCSVKL